MVPVRLVCNRDSTLKQANGGERVRSDKLIDGISTSLLIEQQGIIVGANCGTCTTTY